MSVQRIYDFETALETAFADALAAAPASLTVATPLTSARFQRERPRCEVIFQCGQANQSYQADMNGGQRNASWTGQLKVEVITAAGDGTNGSANHRAYRAAVRNAMATIRNTFSSDCHKLQNLIEAGTTDTYKPQEDEERTALLYTIAFGIDSGAWVELTI